MKLTTIAAASKVARINSHWRIVRVGSFLFPFFLLVPFDSFVSDIQKSYYGRLKASVRFRT